MKRWIFLVMGFFIVNILSAQEFVLEKEKNSLVIESKDSSVFREKGIDSVFLTFENKHLAEGGYCMLDHRDELGELGDWCDWLYLRVVPKELFPLIDLCKEVERGVFRKGNSFKGLMLRIFYDRKGNIFTVSFYVDKKIREKLGDEKLSYYMRKMYASIMKVKVPARFMDIIVSESLKQEKFNRDCFYGQLHMSTNGRERTLADPEWLALKEKFDKEAMKQ